MALKERHLIMIDANGHTCVFGERDFIEQLVPEFVRMFGVTIEAVAMLSNALPDRQGPIDAGFMQALIKAMKDGDNVKKQEVKEDVKPRNPQAKKKPTKAKLVYGDDV